MASNGDAQEREWMAFERGLILGCALGNGKRMTLSEIAGLLGYGGQRDGYFGAYYAMTTARIPGLVQAEDGRWELRMNDEC